MQSASHQGFRSAIMESRPELEHLEGFDQLVEKRGFVNIENPMEVHNLESPGAREAERKYIWKLDLIILPTISALYFSEYIDRGNIAVCTSVNFDC